MDKIERLIAEAEIKDLMYKRIRYLDTKQWHLYGSVHTEDHVSTTFDGDSSDKEAPTDGSDLPPTAAGRKVVPGRDAVVETIRKLMDEPVPLTTCHHVHSPEITFKSEITAESVWAMEDELWWENGEVTEAMHGWGHYHEKYRKEQGKWLICARGLTRLRVVTSADFAKRAQI